MSDSTPTALQSELVLIWQFVRAIFSDWIGWMSGGAGLALTIGAQFMSDLASPGWFWAIGALVFLFACYRAWRKDHAPPIAGKRRLQLLRIIEEGERLLAAEKAIPPGGAQQSLDLAVKMIEWHRETLNSLRTSFPAHWEHFSDIGVFNGDNEMIVKLIRRIREILQP